MVKERSPMVVHQTDAFRNFISLAVTNEFSTCLIIPSRVVRNDFTLPWSDWINPSTCPISKSTNTSCCLAVEFMVPLVWELFRGTVSTEEVRTRALVMMGQKLNRWLVDSM